MSNVLGYDCDGNEIYEYRVLRAIWSNDIDIKELEDADPRLYCALVANDGNAYAISVYDWWSQDLIRKKENIKKDEEIPLVVKPISEMESYEVALCNDSEEEFYYDLDRKELKRHLHIALSIITQDNPKLLIKRQGKVKYSS